jgi:putative transposase
MTFNLRPPPGFRGLQKDAPVSTYQRHLPHWRQAGATYFVTFRLADALPESKLRELRLLRLQWEREHSKPRTSAQWDAIWRDTFRKVDRWLDEGAGSCRLRNEQASSVVASTLIYFHDKRYELGCSVVMPNHVHVVVRPFDANQEALTRITHSWKRHTAKEINQLFEDDGRLWQDESFDRTIRDEEHLWRTIQYIGRNPAKCGISNEASHLWISPRWQECGWNFEV